MWKLEHPLRGGDFVRALALALLLLAGAGTARAQEAAAVLADNASSIAVVIGNRDYRQTVPVDYAVNDANAMRDYLVETMGFRPENVFFLENGTLSEMTQMFGSEARPQSGRLWRSVTEGASNVFVYYSGHGVPDLTNGEPFLLPSDGDPNSADSGYRLDTLYRNLELVKHKVGDDREVIVMIDACFTGETGRGESLLAVSAPGFTPALPETGDGVVRLVATSGDAPANWDDETQHGLFTSRFLMGAAGLADDEGAVEWAALSAYLTEAVAREALRETGRRQVPEIDGADFALPEGEPVETVAQAVESARDLADWDAAQDDRAALERYVAECDLCGFRDEALAQIAALRRGGEAAADRTAWEALSAGEDYQGYLDQCNAVCAYRPVALAYLTEGDPSRDPRVARCDDLAATPNGLDNPDGVLGVPWAALDGYIALEACAAAAASFPDERRLVYQQARALDRLGRYGEALPLYERAGEMGSMEALNGLATLYENGEGVAPSPETAVEIYRRAAEGGNTVAMTNLARVHQYGLGTDLDVDEAIRWYERAAEAGDGFAITKLASAYVSGEGGIPADPERGLELFREGVALGDPLALSTAAVLIDNGFEQHFPGLDPVELLLKALVQGEYGAGFVVATTNGPLNLRAETIRGLQQVVSEEGPYSGAFDGTFNPLFVQSLNRYATALASRSDG